MIYLVEDDESIRELVIYTLKSQGFEAKGFERPSPVSYTHLYTVLHMDGR